MVAQLSIAQPGKAAIAHAPSGRMGMMAHMPAFGIDEARTERNFRTVVAVVTTSAP